MSQREKEIVSASESLDAGCGRTELVTIKAGRHEPGATSVSDLARVPADDSLSDFRRFLEVALRLCSAGSAGLSLLRRNMAGEAVIRWEAVSGALAMHEGNESPRNSSPCGLCLDAETITILPDPQRAFPFLKGTPPWISEDMIIPLYDDTRTPLGTLWIAHHEAASRFGVADAEVARQLAGVLERALRSRELQQSGLIPARPLDLRAAQDLAVERGRREHAEASESRLRDLLLFKDAEIQDAHHRVKNTMQMAASFLQLQAGKSQFAQARTALQEGYCRLQLLAEVHELLYKGSDEARRIPMHDLLQTVAEALQRSFQEKSAQVKFRSVIEPVMLTAAQAIPLAALVNEAITNAYKHAFPGISGEISVTLRLTAGGSLVLQVSDNGIGMPAQSGRAGLGRSLIRNFAAQLGGILTIAAPAALT
jgi:two-component sensor histidine kinase